MIKNKEKYAKEISEEEKTGGWIPVTERLPEPYRGSEV